MVDTTDWKQWGSTGLGRRCEFGFAHAFHVFEMPPELSDISGGKCVSHWLFEN